MTQRVDAWRQLEAKVGAGGCRGGVRLRPILFFASIQPEMYYRGMDELYFFDIPVFRCSFHQWCKEQDLKKERWFKAFSRTKGASVEWAREAATQQANSEWSAYWCSEIVGMIRLFAINRQIRGKLYFVSERVSARLKDKTWRLANPKVFEY